ncbi:hypothetical protein [Mycetocola zhujimingii]|uniref:hypothetical protein n=1 Tax=Mycetocola zhujimingii TaxID=2079792 RepID=UPI001304F567|nr:hypothetical protein [Mycetocola zhujimingii]
MHTFAAMMILLLFVLAAVVVATVASAIALRRDGYRRVPTRGPGSAETRRFIV